jgi:RimJ/RimL family protein N-acetyltransferase
MTGNARAGGRHPWDSQHFREGIVAVASTDSGTNSDADDTLDLGLPDTLTSLIVRERAALADCEDKPSLSRTPGGRSASGLLDDIAEWGPVLLGCGTFRLAPVRIERDLPLIARWMNDPAVAAFWELAGPDEIAAGHLRAQLEGDGRSMPCLGIFDGTPMSYWEVYRADLDPIARHYPARPHDTGLHVLIGAVADRGRGVGTALIRAVCDLVLDRRLRCGRVIAEPDLRNIPSIAAFLGAGFRFHAEADLPGKRAALMIRDRAHRHLL